MSNEDVKVWRTLHLKFTLPGAESEHLLAMMRAAAPFYQMFGNANFRLLRNADDPTKYIQVIEYETPEAFELNRQTLASDMRFQTFIQAWRAMLPGALEVDVYQDVTKKRRLDRLIVFADFLVRAQHRIDRLEHFAHPRLRGRALDHDDQFRLVR